MHVLASAATAQDVLGEIVDAMPHEVVVLDHDGVVVMVNEPFVQFGRANGIQGSADCLGIDYIALCLRAGLGGDQVAAQVALGLEMLIKGRSKHFEMVYPCHSPLKHRWFRLSARPWREGLVLVHEDVTARRIADYAVMRAVGQGPEPIQSDEILDLEPLMMAWAQRMEATTGTPVLVEDCAGAVAIVAAEPFIEGITRLVLHAPRVRDALVVAGATKGRHQVVQITGLKDIGQEAVNGLIEAMDRPPRVWVSMKDREFTVQLMLPRKLERPREGDKKDGKKGKGA